MLCPDPQPPDRAQTSDRSLPRWRASTSTDVLHVASAGDQSVPIRANPDVSNEEANFPACAYCTVQVPHAFVLQHSWHSIIAPMG